MDSITNHALPRSPLFVTIYDNESRGTIFLAIYDDSTHPRRVIRRRNPSLDPFVFAAQWLIAAKYPPSRQVAMIRIDGDDDVMESTLQSIASPFCERTNASCARRKGHRRRHKGTAMTPKTHGCLIIGKKNNKRSDAINA